MGIAAADHEKVFEEFQQVGDPDRQRAGTGLGLALTKRLVEAHGGEISLRSGAGPGQCFHRTVARGDRRQPRTSPGDGRPGAARGGRPAVRRAAHHPAGARRLPRRRGRHGRGRADRRRRPPARRDRARRGPARHRRLRGDPPAQGRQPARRHPGLLRHDHRRAPGRPRPRRRTTTSSSRSTRPPCWARWPRRSPPAPTPRVLVVDHDDTIRQAIEDGLRAGGADVVAWPTAATGWR